MKTRSAEVSSIPRVIAACAPRFSSVRTATSAGLKRPRTSRVSSVEPSSITTIWSGRVVCDSTLSTASPMKRSWL